MTNSGDDLRPKAKWFEVKFLWDTETRDDSIGFARISLDMGDRVAERQPALEKKVAAWRVPAERR